MLQALLKKFGKRNGVVAYQVIDMRVEGVEYRLVSCDEGRLVAVASREVLRGNDCDSVATVRLHKQNLRVIVRKVGTLNDLRDERPKFERLVRSLVVKHQVEARHIPRTLDEEEPAKELL